MKTRRLIVLVMLVLTTALVTAIPAGATEAPPTKPPKEGCTPGYWKQDHHLDSWKVYSPDDLVSDVFGDGPSITLLDALWLKGGGENAFLPHAVAALLNAAHPDVLYLDTEAVMTGVAKTYAGDFTFEYAKDKFEEKNELGCPLD
jgi:hypothetical protein